MRLLIFLFAIVLVYGCGLSKRQGPPLPPPMLEITVNNSECDQYSDYSLEERLRFRPFRNARKIELVSFDDEMEVMLDSVLIKEPRGSVPKKGGKIDRTQLKEIRLLNPVQIDSLTNIFFNFDYGRAENGIISRADVACYEPRHAILFFKKDVDTEPFAYFEVCLACRYVLTFPKQYKLGNFCEGKYDFLRAFFRQTGITYGLDN